MKEHNKETMVVRRSSRVKVKSAILRDEIWNTQWLIRSSLDPGNPTTDFNLAPKAN